MTEPKRWADEDATPLERSLLAAMRGERPGPRLSRRMRRAIGLGGTLVAVKLLGTGLAAAAIVASGIALTAALSNDEPPPPPSERAVPARAPKQPVAPPPPSPSSAEESVPPSPPAPPARPAPRATPTRSSAPSAKADAESALREEIRALDRARAALRSGAPKRALQELDAYGARFPRGTFRQEASVLRIEAIGASGAPERAAALARDFLRRHPESPHADRLARMVGASPASPGVER